jgi:hypothetical protein
MFVPEPAKLQETAVTQLCICDLPYMFLQLQGWWPLGQSYCDTVIDGWLSAALQEWRHGSSINPVAQQAAGGALGSPAAALQHSKPAEASASTGIGSAVVNSLQQQGQHKQQLPSWVDRAVAAGLLDPGKKFDPSTLANILCSCSPELQPLQQAHAVDAVLNAATAPAQQAASAAAAAAKAAQAAAAATQGNHRGGAKGSSAINSGSSNAKHSWLFGFGRAGSLAGPTTPGSALTGLRGEGAWEPFAGVDSGPDADAASIAGLGGAGDAAVTSAGSSSAAGKSGPSAAPAGRWSGWWRGKGSVPASADQVTRQATVGIRDRKCGARRDGAQLRSKL